MRWKELTDPCRYCVAPERYPGCHDHCEKLKAHRESDEYKKLCEYKEKYFRNNIPKNTVAIYHDMRRKKHKGLHMMGYKGMGV
nr:MAG TPA: hypothetical protein [Caudoviricetes sp.]